MTLANGIAILLGNQVAPDFDSKVKRGIKRDTLTVAVSNDGYHYDRAYALRWALPKTLRVSGVTGRGPGAHYPSAIVRDGYLYALYTVGKEDVALSWVALTELGIR